MLQALIRPADHGHSLEGGVAIGDSTLNNSAAMDRFLRAVRSRDLRMAQIAMGNTEDALDLGAGCHV
jgi:hypothetical protein